MDDSSRNRWTIIFGTGGRNPSEQVDEFIGIGTRGGVRILSFFAGPPLRKALILTHGFKKSGRRIFARQREKAAAWFKEFSDIDDINKILIAMEI